MPRLTRGHARDDSDCMPPKMSLPTELSGIGGEEELIFTWTDPGADEDDTRIYIVERQECSGSTGECDDWPHGPLPPVTSSHER